MANRFDEILFDAGHFDGPPVVQTTSDGFTSIVGILATPRATVSADTIPCASISMDAIPRAVVTL